MKKLKGRNKIITSTIVIILIVVALWTQNGDIANYIEENYNISLNLSDMEETNAGNEDKKSGNQSNSSTSKITEHKVVRVVDGDTFIIDYNGTEERVRLIGVDTPESVHPNESKNTEEGIQMSNYTKERLEGKVVKIELDVQERDKYGRILAYVYIDDKMYNKELLELGYAKIATYPPNVKYVEDFTKLQEAARKSKVGLWQ